MGQGNHLSWSFSQISPEQWDHLRLPFLQTFGATFQLQKEKRDANVSFQSLLPLPASSQVSFPWRIVLCNSHPAISARDKQQKASLELQDFVCSDAIHGFYLHQEFHSAWHSSCCSRAMKFCLNKESEEWITGCPVGRHHRVQVPHQSQALNSPWSCFPSFWASFSCSGCPQG